MIEKRQRNEEQKLHLLRKQLQLLHKQIKRLGKYVLEHQWLNFRRWLQQSWASLKRNMVNVKSKVAGKKDVTVDKSKGAPCHQQQVKNDVVLTVTETVRVDCYVLGMDMKLNTQLNWVKIQEAYRKAVLCHPDKNQGCSNEKFQQVKEAFDRLREARNRVLQGNHQETDPFLKKKSEAITRYWKFKFQDLEQQHQQRMAEKMKKKTQSPTKLALTYCPPDSPIHAGKFSKQASSQGEILPLQQVTDISSPFPS